MAIERPCWTPTDHRQFANSSSIRKNPANIYAFFSNGVFTTVQIAAPPWQQTVVLTLVAKRIRPCTLAATDHLRRWLFRPFAKERRWRGDLANHRFLVDCKTQHEHARRRSPQPGRGLVYPPRRYRTHGGWRRHGAKRRLHRQRHVAIDRHRPRRLISHLRRRCLQRLRLTRQRRHVERGRDRSILGLAGDAARDLRGGRRAANVVPGQARFHTHPDSFLNLHRPRATKRNRDRAGRRGQSAGHRHHAMARFSNHRQRPSEDVRATRRRRRGQGPRRWRRPALLHPSQ